MREVWIPLGGVRLFAVEDGHGPALVMLHGGLANHQAVLPLLTPLTARHRVIAPDLRGSGRSWSPEPLTFDRLADDVAQLLDHLSIDRAIVGGVSSGTGVAVRFALRHPSRVRGLVLVKPVYAGADAGYTSGQEAAFAAMDSVASRAPAEGIEVLRALYARLPEGFRERAWEVAAEFDPGSVAATSRFIASGVQPFASSADLRSIGVPTLLVRGDDPQHPAGVSDLYAASIANCSALPATTEDLATAIGSFCDRVARGAA
ncbi:MAG TPA: alpha/beta hydrolase [Longimicrobium sp.]|jgi:pimeloyl-ACP methyl ester carboxylesterase